MVIKIRIFGFDLHVTMTLLTLSKRSHRTHYTNICSIKTNESQDKNWPNQLGNSIQKNLWCEMLQITISIPYTWTPSIPYTWTPSAKNTYSSFGVVCKKHFPPHQMSHSKPLCFIVNTNK
jgi:hypothetical protein